MLKNFDYYNSSYYKIGAISFGIGLASKYHITKKWFIYGDFRGIAIPLGGASTEYFNDEFRNYNLGIGAGGKIMFVIIKENSLRFYVDFNKYIIHTTSGAQGTENIGMGKIEMLKLLYRDFGIAGSFVFYERKGVYCDFQDVYNFNRELRATVNYGFK